MKTGIKVWLICLALISLFLRLPGLFANTFHGDEALFATWARLIATWKDPLLQSQLVDKPPLLFYSQAVIYPLFGPVEYAARMPNFIASILLVPLGGILAWKLYRHDLTAVMVAAFVAFSPLAIQFSSTAFTDPLLTFLLTASLTAMASSSSFRKGNALNERPPAGLAVTEEQKPNVCRATNFRPVFVAGVLFGLALATKYQAWLFLPLLIGLGILCGWRKREWLSWLGGASIVLICLVLWEMSHSGSLALWPNQLASFGGLRLAWSWELWPRLEAWVSAWGYLMDAPVLGFALILAMPPFLALLIDQQDWETAVDQLLVVFVSYYFVIHWFVAVPVWERYILPIMPLAGLVLTRLVWRLLSFVQRNLSNPATDRFLRGPIPWTLPFLLLVFQLPAVWSARAGQLPIGGQPESDMGAAIIAEVLSDAPYGTVLYDHWFSWQWRYHFLDRRVYINWFPDAAELVQDLSVFADGSDERYLALPPIPEAESVRRALRESGYLLQPVRTALLPDGQEGITLYRIDIAQSRDL